MKIIEHITGACGEYHLNIYSVFLITLLLYFTVKQLIKNARQRK